MTPRSLIEAASFVEFGLVEILARIARVRPQELDRRLALGAGPVAAGRVFGDVAEQRGEPAAKTRPDFGWACGVFRHGLSPNVGGGDPAIQAARHRASRLMTSEASFK